MSECDSRPCWDLADHLCDDGEWRCLTHCVCAGDDVAPAARALGPEVETYREWRLTGHPDGDFPFYNHTFHDRERVEALLHIWRKVQSGEYPWKDAKLQSRKVTIERTAWKDDPLAEGKERSDP